MHSGPVQSHQNFALFLITQIPFYLLSWLSFYYFQFPWNRSYQRGKTIPMDESRFLLELKFESSLCLNKFMNSLCVETISFLSMFSSDPLFSCFITFCTLVFLYLPHLFWKIVFSPVLILTGILLLSILRLGAIQNSQHEQNKNQGKSEPIIIKEENRASNYREEKQSSSSPIEFKETDSLERVHMSANSSNRSEIVVDSEMGFESSSSFVEWNVGAPLEVIYEEYEGEEAGDDPNEREENQNTGFPRYPSLSRFYPESDSDSSSESGYPAMGDWDSPEDIFFRWDEDDREGLIEIALDGSKMKRDLGFRYEEENLIEIDISPTRYKELSGDHGSFPVRSAATNALLIEDFDNGLLCFGREWVKGKNGNL